MTIQKIITSIGAICARSRARYVEIQDDLPEGWTLSSTLGMFGLGSIAGSKPAPAAIDPEIARTMLAKL